MTRTDSLGAGLTQQIAVSHKPGDLGDQYNSFLDCEEVTAANARNGDVIINQNGKMMRPEASAQQPLPVPSRHRCGSLRARLHHFAAERR